jgi:TRAP-type uncharacterized transport system fused permease subunit
MKNYIILFFLLIIIFAINLTDFCLDCIDSNILLSSFFNVIILFCFIITKQIIFKTERLKKLLIYFAIVIIILYFVHIKINGFKNVLLLPSYELFIYSIIIYLIKPPLAFSNEKKISVIKRNDRHKEKK